MINDIKTGLKLLKYGLQFKTMLVMLVMFFALGTVMELFATDAMSNMGGMYLVITGSYIYQLIVTTSIANVIQSSVIKKKIQTILPSMFCGTIILVMYLFFAALRYFRTSKTMDFSDPNQVSIAFSGLIAIGILAFIIQIYNGICYKYFMPAMIVMLIFMIPVLVFSMNGRINTINFGSATHPYIYFIAGLALVLCGGIIGYFLSLLVYKKGIDPKTYKAAMARAGK